MTYGPECWTVKKKDEIKMNKTEMRMLQWITVLVWTCKTLI